MRNIYILPCCSRGGDKKMSEEKNKMDATVVEYDMDGFWEVVYITNIQSNETVKMRKKEYEELRDGWDTDDCFDSEETYEEADGKLTDKQIFGIVRERDLL